MAIENNDLLVLQKNGGGELRKATVSALLAGSSSLWEEDGNAVTPKKTGADLKIEGGITAAGDIQAGGNAEDASRPAGLVIRNEGSVTIARGAAQNIIAGYTTGTDSETFVVTGSGSITAAGEIRATDGDNYSYLAATGWIKAYKNKAGGNALSDLLFAGENDTKQVFSVFTDGSITADGDIKNGNTSPSNNSGEGGNILYGSSGGIRVYRTVSGVSAAIDVENNGTQVFAANTDGSVNAAGAIRAGDTVETATSSFGVIDPSGQLLLQNKEGDNTKAVFIAFDGTYAAGQEAIKMIADGSAVFAGTVTAKSTVDAYGVISKGTTGSTNIWTGYLIDGVTNPVKSTITAGGTFTSGEVNVASADGYGIKLDLQANAGAVIAQAQQTASQYTALIETRRGVDQTFVVTANGTLRATTYNLDALNPLP